MPVSEVQWVKDGNVIARNDGGLVKITQFTEGQSQLLISSSTKQDEGNYTCLSQMLLTIPQIQRPFLYKACFLKMYKDNLYHNVISSFCAMYSILSRFSSI